MTFFTDANIFLKSTVFELFSSLKELKLRNSKDAGIDKPVTWEGLRLKGLASDNIFSWVRFFKGTNPLCVRQHPDRSNSVREVNFPIISACWSVVLVYDKFRETSPGINSSKHWMISTLSGVYHDTSKLVMLEKHLIPTEVILVQPPRLREWRFVKCKASTTRLESVIRLQLARSNVIRFSRLLKCFRPSSLVLSHQLKFNALKL